MSDNNLNMGFAPQSESRNCFNENAGCGNSRECCNNGGILGRLGGFGCGNGCDSEILFFIIIFLLLFTNFGCGCGR